MLVVSLPPEGVKIKTGNQCARRGRRAQLLKGLARGRMPEEPIITPEEIQPKRVSAFGLLLRASFFVLLSGSVATFSACSCMAPSTRIRSG